MKRLSLVLLIAILLCHSAYGGFNGYLKADTATIVTIGPFVDVGDGFTPQTDIALSGNEAELIKHGSTSVVDISGSTWAAVTNCRGYYSLTLTTGNTDTEGQLTVIVQDDSDCLPVRNTFIVVNANVYDSLFAAATTDYLQVDTIQVTGTSQTANDMSGDIDDILTDTGTTLDDLIDTEIGTIVTAVGNIETDTAAYDTDAEYATAIWNALTNAYGGAGTYGQAAEDVLVDTSTTIPGTITTAQNDLDTITGGSGVLIDTDAVDADALKTDAITEFWAQALSDLAAGAPSATASVLTGINYLYEAWRNQTWATSTEIAIYKDDASTPLVESTISDDGTTFKREEMRAPD